MAEKKKEAPEKPELTKRQREVITRATSRVDKGMEAVREDFGEALEDLRMCNNEEHWDATILAKRQQAGRPSLVLNEFVPAIRDLKGEQAETKPYTTIKPVRDGARREVAEIMAGYLRNIKHECKADDAYDNAFGQQIQGGFGCYRIMTEFEGGSFNQTIKIKPILNQFAVVFDENAEEWHKNDGEWMAHLSYFSKEEFERRWPGVTPQNFNSSNVNWYPSGKNKFMVAEYYEKEHKKENIFQLESGKIIKGNQIPPGIDKQVGSVMPNLEKIVKKRSIDTITIYRYLLCAHAVLEDKEEWGCDLWPIIPVDGDKISIQNKVSRRGLIRFGRDGQRALNLYESTKAEALSMVPKAPVYGTPAMFEGFEDQWLGAMDGTYDHLLYNPDPMMPGGKPERLFGLDPSYIGALAQSTQQSKDAIRQAIGPNIQLPRSAKSLPQVSGTALGRWQQEGDTSTYIFFDNLQKAIEWGDLVCVRLMKRILDTSRTITIRKPDFSTEEVEINKPVVDMDPRTQQPIARVVNDMTKGEYGVETALGPSYMAQKMALSDKMMNFARALPPQILAGTAHILAGMMFDISQGGQEAQGGALLEFVKQVKKILLKMGMLDPTDLKEEELKDFAPMLLMMRQKPMPPAMAAKLRVEAGKAASLFARAEKDLATAGQVKAENAIQIMDFLRLLGVAAMEPMVPPQVPQPGQPGKTPGPPGPGPGGMMVPEAPPNLVQ